MVSSGYATEATFESIWDTLIDTTRFNNLNVRIGSLLNGIIHEDDATDITDTSCTETLAHITEEMIIRILQISKSEATDNPWDFLPILSLSNIRRYYGEDIRRIQIKLGYYAMKINSASLPSSSERTF